ncbi:proline-rich transmembrane protein 1-like [Amphiura filiformis]|uniref:proline-rich transmembrane protein 1-like n=1 Tax=Amphiura filiformis TaxID=82378 RepID=UPI003B216F63
MADKKGLINKEEIPMSTAYGSPAHQNHAHAVHNTETQYQQHIMGNPYQEHIVNQQPRFGPSPQVMPICKPPPPEDYLVKSVLVTVLCCLPFGIVGIVQSGAAKTSYAAGNYQEAERLSQSARLWSITGLICGIVITVVYITLIFVARHFMNMSSSDFQNY